MIQVFEKLAESSENITKASRLEKKAFLGALARKGVTSVAKMLGKVSLKAGKTMVKNPGKTLGAALTANELGTAAQRGFKHGGHEAARAIGNFRAPRVTM